MAKAVAGRSARAVHEALEAQHFNCLTMIAALGFGDIPPEAFTVAYNFIEDGGLPHLLGNYLQAKLERGFKRRRVPGLLGALRESLAEGPPQVRVRGFGPLKRDDRHIPDDVFSLFPVLNSMLGRRGGDV